MQNDEFQYYLEKAQDLLELEEKILNLSLDLDVEIFTSLFEEFYDGVVEIRNAFITKNAVPIDIADTDDDSVDFLQAVLNNDTFEEVENKKREVAINYFFQNAVSKNDAEDFEEWVSRAFEETEEHIISKYQKLWNLGKSDYSSLDDLSYEYLYDWFGPTTYVEDLRDAGAILVNSKDLPGNFTYVISTIKQCYAFHQYLAVIVLCRTTLEIALRDIYIKLGFTKKGSDTNAIAYNYFVQIRGDKNSKYPNEYDPSPSDLRKIICKLPEYQEFEEELTDLYGKLSRVIHGSLGKGKSRGKAGEFMKQTVWLIHDLYKKLNTVK